MRELECPICKGKVLANSRGQILAHTDQRTSYGKAEACKGSTPGARPDRT